MRRLTTMFAAVCLLAGLIAPAALASARSGTYTGKTSQHYRVKLKVKKNSLHLVRFSIKLRCRDGSILIDQESGFQAARLRRGKFKQKQFGSTDAVVFKGKASGSRVKGTLKVKDRAGKVRCSSPTVRFTAHRK